MSFNLAAANRTIISTGLATTLTDWGVTVLVDCSTGPHTVTLPPAAGNAGATINVIKIDGTINQLTISGTGADRINGHLTLTYVEPYAAVSMESGDGTTIVIVADSFPRFAPSLVHTSSFGVLDNSDLSCFRVDPSALPITVTINPVLDGRVGRLMIFKNIGTSTNAITLSPLAGTIEGAASYTMDQPNQCVVVCVTSLSTMAVVASFPGGADDGVTTVGFGVGADFDTLADAVDSGAQRIQVVADCFELRDTISVRDLVLDILGNVHLDMGDFQIKMWGPNTQNRISCEGDIAWSPTTPKHLFEGQLDPFTGDVNAGFPQVTNTSVGTAGMRVGMLVTGPDVPGDTSILSIDGPNAFTMTQNATATVAGEAFNSGSSSFNLSAVGRLEINGTAATANDCHVVHGCTSFACVGVLVLQLPNQHGWGLHLGDAQIYIQGGPLGLIQNVGGGNCYDLLSIGGGIGQLLLIGSFHPTNPIISPTAISIQSIVAPFSSPLNISVGGYLGEYSGPALMNVAVLAAGTVIENCHLQGGTIDVASFGSVTLCNVSAAAALNTLATSPGATVFNNVALAGIPYALDTGSTRAPLVLMRVVSAIDSPVIPGREETIFADATAGPITVTLPTAATISGRVVSVKKTDAGVNAVTVTPVGGQFIDGAVSYVLAAQYDAVTIYSDSAGWRVLARISPAGTGDVVGPASSTDNHLVRWDGVTGRLVQDSLAILSDAGGLSLFPTSPAPGLSVTHNNLTVPAIPAALIQSDTLTPHILLKLQNSQGNAQCLPLLIQTPVIGATIDAVTIIGGGSTIRMQEIPAATQAVFAGQGQIFVKNTTPNRLGFTDDVGNEVTIGQVSGLKSAQFTPIGGLFAIQVDADAVSLQTAVSVQATNSQPGRTLLYVANIGVADPNSAAIIESNNGAVPSFVLRGPGAATLMTEQAAPPGGPPAAGLGLLWTYDNGGGPSRLAFTDDAGVTMVFTGSGDVVGPAGAVDRTLPVFDGVTGKLLANASQISVDVFGHTAMSPLPGVPNGALSIAGDNVGAAAVMSINAANAVLNRTGINVAFSNAGDTSVGIRLDSAGNQPGLHLVNGAAGIFIGGLAAAPGASAFNFGTLWCKSGSPTKLAFTNSAGDEVLLNQPWKGPTTITPASATALAPYDATLEEIILADLTGGGTAYVRLPPAASATQDVGRAIVVKVSVADPGGAVGFETQGGGTIDFGASYTFSGTTRASVTAVCTGSNNFIVT